MSGYSLLHRGNPLSDLQHYDCPYSEWEIRSTIKEFYKLPQDHEIVMDIKRVYPYLGKEYQDMFILYAMGYPLGKIALYWQGIHTLKGYKDSVNQRKHGNYLVRMLIRRIQWFLSLHILPMESAPYLV